MFQRTKTTVYKCAYTAHCRPGAWIRAVKELASSNPSCIGWMKDESFRALHKVAECGFVFVSYGHRDYALLPKDDCIILIVRGIEEYCDTAILPQTGNSRCSWPSKRRLSELPKEAGNWQQRKPL